MSTKKELENTPTPSAKHHNDLLNTPVPSQETFDAVEASTTSPHTQEQTETKTTTEHSTLLKKILSSAGFTIFLATITSFVFILSHNLRMFNPETILFVSLFRILYAFLLGGIFYLITAYVIDNKKMPRWITIPATIVLCILICRFTFLLMYNSLEPTIDKTSTINLVSIILGIFMSLIVYKSSFKPFNIFFGIIFLFSLSTLSYNTLLSLFEKQNHESPVLSIPEMQNHEALEHISINLKNKPNIYLFILESYNDLNMMREIYSIDTKPLEQLLHKHGFTIYDDVYSNGQTTLIALYRLYMMAMTNERTKKTAEVSQGARRVLGGHRDNRLFTFLKGQGYTTSSFYPDPSYYFFKQEEMLDTSNFSNIIPSWLQALIIGSSKIQHYILPYSPHLQGKSREEFLHQTMLAHEKQDKPLFFVFKGGATHVSGLGADVKNAWKKEQEWIKKYQGLIEAGNKQIFEKVEYITGKDKNALIILLADHGPYRLLGAWDEAIDSEDFISESVISDKKSLETSIRQKNISPQDVVDDTFKIFLAIRMPKGFDQDISYGYDLSPVNLFRHIFSALNKDDAFLQERVESLSILSGTTVYKDGKHLLSK